MTRAPSESTRQQADAVFNSTTSAQSPLMKSATDKDRNIFFTILDSPLNQQL
jgi:hypothetical protein